MTKQAQVTVKGIEITLSQSETVKWTAPFSKGFSVSASTECECGTSLSYGGGFNRPGKVAVRGLLVMIDNHDPMHQRFMQAKAR